MNVTLKMAAAGTRATTLREVSTVVVVKISPCQVMDSVASVSFSSWVMFFILLLDRLDTA